MPVKELFLNLAILLLCAVTGNAQEHNAKTGVDLHSNINLTATETSEEPIRTNSRNESIAVHFKFDKHDIDLNYKNNRAALQQFTHTIDSIGISNIDSVVIATQSSPDGAYEHNIKLSKNRAAAMYKYIIDKHPELCNRLHVHSGGEAWSQLREYVSNDTQMKDATIKTILSIIDSDINVGTKKWRLQQLPIYKYLLKTYYPLIRNSTFYILYYKETILPKLDIDKVESDSIVEVSEQKNEIVADTHNTDTVSIVEPEVSIADEWTRHIYIKTNAIGLGMGIANIAAEIDLAEHWSFTLPIYYSAWNYFKYTNKFRTFAVQPEVRYWLKDDNQGFFAGAHFGYAQYNVGISGEDYRYQDHNGNSPALGGGISVGYRLPISKNDKWHLEFTVGAGVYDLHYDMFYNVENGKLYETRRKTYWGLDNAAINFSYRFDLNKRKK